jgi:co-chaperonin GroES (HSP10)
MSHSDDPRREVLDKLGDISAIEVFNNQVLVATYFRPERSKGGIIMPSQVRDEDRFQGKVALVVAKGASAFEPGDSNWFKGVSLGLHDWIVFRPSDGWEVQINGILCRLLDDTAIRARVDRPDRVW